MVVTLVASAVQTYDNLLFFEDQLSAEMFVEHNKSLKYAAGKKQAANMVHRALKAEHQKYTASCSRGRHGK